MKISYDAKVYALYIQLTPGKQRVQCRDVDEDISLDFDEQDRLVGIEVLDASRRLDLKQPLLEEELQKVQQQLEQRLRELSALNRRFQEHIADRMLVAEKLRELEGELQSATQRMEGARDKERNKV
ncbi:MAG: DUF2283 domain-containing protein [SAR202 cluster bacterium]|nr:DUF2283 domain-containing protein [SAR202 cluster bacterium]